MHLFVILLLLLNLLQAKQRIVNCLMDPEAEFVQLVNFNKLCLSYCIGAMIYFIFICFQSEFLLLFRDSWDLPGFYSMPFHRSLLSLNISEFLPERRDSVWIYG